MGCRGRRSSRRRDACLRSTYKVLNYFSYLDSMQLSADLVCRPIRALSNYICSVSFEFRSCLYHACCICIISCATFPDNMSTTEEIHYDNISLILNQSMGIISIGLILVSYTHFPGASQARQGSPVMIHESSPLCPHYVSQKHPVADRHALGRLLNFPLERGRQSCFASGRLCVAGNKYTWL